MHSTMHSISFCNLIALWSWSIFDWVWRTALSFPPIFYLMLSLSKRSTVPFKSLIYTGVYWDERTSLSCSSSSALILILISISLRYFSLSLCSLDLYASCALITKSYSVGTLSSIRPLESWFRNELRVSRSGLSSSGSYSNYNKKRRKVLRPSQCQNLYQRE